MNLDKYLLQNKKSELITCISILQRMKKGVLPFDANMYIHLTKDRIPTLEKEIKEHLKNINYHIDILTDKIELMLQTEKFTVKEIEFLNNTPIAILLLNHENIIELRKKFPQIEIQTYTSRTTNNQILKIYNFN